MRLRRALAPAVVAAVVLAAWLPGGSPVRAADPYSLDSTARYEIRPAEGVIGVRVAIEFRNTTPDPANRFSVFTEIVLAVHDEAVGFSARDDDGRLSVRDARRTVDGEPVHVAVIQLRDAVRYRESAELELRYRLPDTEDSRLRVRPSLIVFPAWGFGTASQVSVAIPAGYELRVDGDPLTEEDGRLVSGRIDDPTAWLALVTAVRPAEYVTEEVTVPLEGGTADLVVRSFADDESWGRRTMAVVEKALPAIEEEVGLPYPVRGPLTLTEAVPADASGFGEGATNGTEIMVAFDQPAFTALHQVVHLWVPPDLVDALWIREGLASRVAERVATRMEVRRPYDPSAEAERRADAAFPLDEWAPDAGLDAVAYGHAASWALMAELEEEVGADVLRAVLARVAASIGPYEPGSVDQSPLPGTDEAPAVPLTSRSLLDHLETLSGANLAGLFADRVLSEADTDLLGARTAAQAELDALVEQADGWGAPDPVRADMTAWRFDAAMAQIETVRAWLAQRDRLLAALADAGLAAPDRLQQAYLAYGGGPEAVGELDAEREVVDAYAAAAERVNAERTFIERLGLVGGANPQAQLVLANGRFTDGDLRGAAEAIGEADRIVAAAETGGIVRLVSLVLVVLIGVGLAVILFRRRASYTGGP